MYINKYPQNCINTSEAEGVMDGSVKRNPVLDYQLVSKFAFPQPPNSSEKNVLCYFHAVDLTKTWNPLYLVFCCTIQGHIQNLKKSTFLFPRKALNN